MVLLFQRLAGFFYPLTMRVLFFAHLQDVTGCTVRELALSAPVTGGQLWDLLLAEYPGLAGHRGTVRLARDWDYVDADTRFSDGDEVALIPPVSGG